MKIKMLRKIAAVILAFTLLLSFAACNGGKDADITLPEKKVAIVVAPEAQYPEDYAAANELAAKYPDNIVVKEYSDSRILRAGDAEIIQRAKELAADKEIGAIVFARATQFTVNAINAAKQINPEIKTICVEPEESIEKISKLADLVYCADWKLAAEDIVNNAIKQGAEYFVVFSINRHISENPLLREANQYIKEACEAKGITYIYDGSIDPIYSSGIAGAKQYIKESVARLFNNNKVENNNVALFSTDSSVQSTLIEVANQRGLIYVSPSFPGAYNGIGEVYEISKPESITDIKTYIKNTKAAVEADTEGKAKLSMYNFALASTLMQSAVYSAFDMLNGTFAAESATAWATKSADNKNFSVAAYGELTNAYMCYCPGFEVIK